MISKLERMRLQLRYHVCYVLIVMIMLMIMIMGGKEMWGMSREGGGVGRGMMFRFAVYIDK